MTNPNLAPSPADFETWHEAPWFRDYLSQQIEDLDARINECAKNVLICPRDMIDHFRVLTAGYAGQLTELETFRDLTLEDVTPEEDEDES